MQLEKLKTNLIFSEILSNCPILNKVTEFKMKVWNYHYSRYVVDRFGRNGFEFRPTVDDDFAPLKKTFLEVINTSSQIHIGTLYGKEFFVDLTNAYGFFVDTQILDYYLEMLVPTHHTLFDKAMLKAYEGKFIEMGDSAGIDFYDFCQK